MSKGVQKSMSLQSSASKAYQVIKYVISGTEVAYGGSIAHSQLENYQQQF